MEKSVLQNDNAGFFIFADDMASPGTGKTGLAILTTLSKNGAAATSIAPAVTERSDVADGVYWIQPLAAHRDTLGRLAFGFASPGAIIAPRFEKVVAIDDQSGAWNNLLTSAGQIVIGTVDDSLSTPGITEFSASDITEATDDHYNGRIVIFTSGVLAGQATDITDYELISGQGRLTVSTMTDAPVDGDTFIIV